MPRAPLVLSLVLLAGCGGPESASGPVYEAMPSSTTSAGGEAAREDPLPYVQRGISLVRVEQCVRAMREGFEPALALFEARHAGRGRPLAASRVVDPGAADGDAPLGPAWSDTMYLQAFCLIESGDLVTAADYLQRALTMIPNDVVYGCELGHVQQRAAAHDEALATFQAAVENARALQGHPAMRGAELFGHDLSWWERRALRGVGFSLIELGRLEDAERVYRRVLSIEPTDERAIQELQLILTRRGAI